MTAPEWWSSEVSGLIGGLGGAAIGILGALEGGAIAWLMGTGRNPSGLRFVHWFLISCGVLLLSLAAFAAFVDQPWHVVSSPGLLGFLLVTLWTAGLFVLRKLRDQAPK